MTINNETNTLSLVVTGNSITTKELVPKQGAHLLLVGSYVYLEFEGPANSHKKLKLDYNNVTDPVTASASALYDALDTMINS